MFKFDKASSRNWEYIIIHHSATVDQRTFDWDTIGRYHVFIKGWQAIGYHWGVEKHNGEYIYCVGRGLNLPGAHTLGMNDKAIGICLIGNFDATIPNIAQYWFLASLCKDLMRDFNIPIENIKLHRDYSEHKSCPGSNFSLDRLIKLIKPDVMCV